MKNYRIFFVAFIFFAAIAAISAAYGYSKVAGMVDVAVAQSDILPDEIVSSKNISLGKTPQGAMNIDSVKSPAELKGMTARGYIPSGTVLRLSMFRPEGKAGAAAKLAPGQVALAVATDINTTCGDEIKAGSKVNIKVVKKLQNKDITIETVAENIEILSVKEKSVVLAIDKSLSESYINGKSIGEIVFELLPTKGGD